MGMEGVEIVMAVEETFGISIPDDVAQQILTVRQLVDYVTTQVATAPEPVCSTKRLFYQLRRGFKAEVSALVPRFDLDVPLDHDAVRCGTRLPPQQPPEGVRRNRLLGRQPGRRRHRRHRGHKENQGQRRG